MRDRSADLFVVRYEATRRAVRPARANAQRRHSASLRGLLQTLAFAFVATTAFSAQRTLLLPLTNTLAGTKGEQPQQFTRGSAATYFDAATGKLTDVGANQPRFETYPGKPWGASGGVLLEYPTANLIPNSSFELGVAGWTGSESVKLAPAEDGLHGKAAMKVTGRGRVLHQPVTLTVMNVLPLHNLFTISGYVRRADGAPLTFQDVAPCAMPVGKTGSVQIGGSMRCVRLGTTAWYRVSADFGVNGGPLSDTVWTCGFEKQGEVDLLIDAVQLEQGTPRWYGGATSYIPTADAPVKRDGEILTYPATNVLGARGSFSLWVRPVEPQAGYFFYALPSSPASFVLLASGFNIAGVGHNYASLKPGWSFLTFTWGGGKAQLYVNGEGVRPQDDLLEYKDFAAFGATSFALSRVEGAADALIADVTVWDSPLTPAQARQLFRTGDIAGAVEPPPEKMTTLRVNVPAAGNTSVGLYDSSGTLVRTLFSGKTLPAGERTAEWDGRNDDGKSLPVGSYTARGVVSQVGVAVEQLVGNTAPNRPVDDYNVYRCMYGGYVSLAMLPDGSCIQQAEAIEGSFTGQRVAADGKVIWSKQTGFDAFSYYTIAVASDGKHVYTLQPSMVDVDPVTKKLRSYQSLGRCDAQTGERVLFPGEQPMLAVTPTRMIENVSAGIQSDAATYSDPYPNFDARSVAVGNGKIYIPLFFENRIDIYDAEKATKIGEYADIAKPQGLATDATGNLYVCSEQQVFRITPAAKRSVVVSKGLAAPWSLTVDAAGNLYVCDLGTQQVKKFSSIGVLQKTIGVAGGNFNGKVMPNGFAMPMAVAVDPKGNILIADRMHWRVQVFAPDGKRLVQSRMSCGTNIPFLHRTKPEWLYGEGWGAFGLQIARYQLDWRKKHWRLDSMWQIRQAKEFADFRPVIGHGGSWWAVELGGHTYLYKLTGTLLFRLERDRVVPCTMLGGGGTSVPIVRDATGNVVKLDLSRRWVWVNRNGDDHCQPDEFTFYDKRGWEQWRSSYVLTDGTLMLNDRSTVPISSVRIPLQGLDAKGNPLYSWADAKPVWTIPPDEATQTRATAWGFRALPDGRAFALIRDDNYGSPLYAYLAGYDAKGKRMWKSGKLSGGILRPTEFTQPENVNCPGDGMVYAGDVNGMVQVFTEDGLFVARLLKSCWIGDDTSEFCNGGETFDSHVERVGNNSYLVQAGNAAFRASIYRVTGLESVQRFEAKVELTEQAPPRITAPASAELVRKTQRILPAKRTVTIDGTLDDWDTSAGETITVPGGEGRFAATGHAAYDAENLYLAYAITDSSPAMNTGVLSTLFNGDAIEAFISIDSNVPITHSWTPQDYQFCAASMVAEGNAPKRSQLTQIQTSFKVVPGADTSVRIWPDRKGYNVEIKLPWSFFGEFRPTPGRKVGWDWNIDWSDASGSVRALQYYWNNSANWQNPAMWGIAEFQ